MLKSYPSTERKLFKVKCILCDKKSETTDKETSQMKRWICWDCVDKIKKEKAMFKDLLKEAE